MTRHLIGALLGVAVLAAAVSPALAQHRRDEGWRDRDIHRFHDHDFDRWRGGRWFHGVHDGRVGWWWIVGPEWYFYPRPIYPYPAPYPAYAVPGAPAWYFCPPAQQYYPYVPSCPVPWQIVPAQ
jgi:hypothetical protein